MEIRRWKPNNYLLEMSLDYRRDLTEVLERVVAPTIPWRRFRVKEGSERFHCLERRKSFDKMLRTDRTKSLILMSIWGFVPFIYCPVVVCCLEISRWFELRYCPLVWCTEVTILSLLWSTLPERVYLLRALNIHQLFPLLYFVLFFEILKFFY
jgi:hypothetical protein